VDLGDIEAVKAFVGALNVPIGLLVYNAAYAPVGLFKDIEEEQLARIVAVNVRGPLLLAHLVLPKMAERKRGGIVLMSSLAGTQGSPKLASYAATKAFNAILAEGLWEELKPFGIDVIASCAGAILTPGYNQAQQARSLSGFSPFNGEFCDLSQNYTSQTPKAAPESGIFARFWRKNSQVRQAARAPGTLTAAEVAERTLKALGKGPVFVPGGINKLARFFLMRLMPRKLAVKIMAANTRSLN
jgi:short-subunit dehydrogenase